MNFLWVTLLLELEELLGDLMCLQLLHLNLLGLLLLLGVEKRRGGERLNRHCGALQLRLKLLRLKLLRRCHLRELQLLQLLYLELLLEMQQLLLLLLLQLLAVKLH